MNEYYFRVEISNLEVYVSGDMEGMYNVTVNATISSEVAADSEIRCELFYQNKNISHPPYVETIYYSTGMYQTLPILSFQIYING